jgi:hypothetical protein
MRAKEDGSGLLHVLYCALVTNGGHLSAKAMRIVTAAGIAPVLITRNKKRGVCEASALYTNIILLYFIYYLYGARRKCSKCGVSVRRLVNPV